MKPVKSLDKSALVNLYNIGGKEFLLRMIDNFLAKSEERVRAVRNSLSNNDLKAIHLIAHSLKASSANLGAAKVQEMAERLEEMASIGLKDHMGDVLEKLDEALADAMSCLQSERRQWDSGTAETLSG